MNPSPGLNPESNTLTIIHRAPKNKQKHLLTHRDQRCYTWEHSETLTSCLFGTRLLYEWSGTEQNTIDISMYI